MVQAYGNNSTILDILIDKIKIRSGSNSRIDQPSFSVQSRREGDNSTALQTTAANRLEVWYHVKGHRKSRKNVCYESDDFPL